MRKLGLRLIAFCLVSLLALSGCRVIGGKDQDVIKTIEAPINKRLPLRGTWRVTEIAETSKDARSKTAFSKGSELYLTSDLLGIGSFFTVNPTYSAKHVDLADYLVSRYPAGITISRYTDKEIDVLMVRDNDAVNLDIMRLDETHICFVHESRVYYLERISQDVAKDVIESYTDMAAKAPNNAFAQKDKVDLTTFVAIKQKRIDENEHPYYSYSTYMIQDNQEYTHPRIFMMDQIFLPNQEGQAFQLSYEIKRHSDDHGVEEAKFTYKPFSSIDLIGQDMLTDTANRSITYINSSFVSFDKPVYVSPEVTDFYKYELHNLNSLGSNAPFKISDLSKSTEENSFKEKILEQLTYIDPSGEIDPSKIQIDYENLGVVRTSSDWRYVTSQLWTTSTKTYPSRIFIDLVTKVPVIDFAALGIPWTRVTNKQPLAKTAFTSTNKERLLIQTEDELQYYKLFGDTVKQSPEFSIQLPKHSEVIMIDCFYDTNAAHLASLFLSGTLRQPQVLFSNRMGQMVDTDK